MAPININPNEIENIEFKFTNIDKTIPSIVNLQHLYWIDLANDENFINFSNDFHHLPQSINYFKPVTFHVPANYFHSGKKLYKLVAQYEDVKKKQYISFYDFHVSKLFILFPSI